MPDVVIQVIKNYERRRIIRKWRNNGSLLPPPHELKQIIIQQYFEIYNYCCFIETRTYMGKMVEAQKRRFKKIFSIELWLDLYKKAVERFKKDKNVTIIHGDSGEVLRDLMKSVYVPTIFWLDGIILGA